MVRVPGGRWWSILRQRCPRCGRGPIFARPLTMHVRCPSCGLQYQRDSGYFTGAMYFSYALGIPIITVLTLIVHLIRPGWHLWQDVLVAWLLFLPLVPGVFQYSRVFWIHLDRYFDPDPHDDAPWIP